MSDQVGVVNTLSQKRIFAGIPVYNLNEKEATQLLFSRLSAAQKTLLMFANSHFIVNCQSLLPKLSSEQVFIFNDGVSIDAVSKILYGRQFKENLNGTDFVPKLLKKFPTPQKVVLVGSRPGVAALAGEYIETHSNCRVLAAFDGFKDMQNNQLLIEKINALKPDIVMIGLGNPLQESWMLNHENQLNVPLIIGVGALFDFLSGTIQRAPLWVRNLRLEWFYRLCLEPRRLFKRYTVEVVRFFYICL